MADRVHRITMFKMPKKEDQDKMLEKYKILGAKQEKVGISHIPHAVFKPNRYMAQNASRP